MLTYCFVPVELPFEVAGPALIESLGVCEELISAAERQGWRTLCQMGLTNEKSAGEIVFEYRMPLVDGTRVIVSTTCCSQRNSLTAMEADIILSKLSPSLCHLSIRSSTSRKWARSLVNNREFQMVMEVAVARFLDNLVNTLTSVARD
ncbi:MAG: hypothetical protein WD602_10025 [Actinomycetota bacterium]